MLDGIHIGLDPDGIRVLCNERWMAPKDIPKNTPDRSNCFNVKSLTSEHKLSIGFKKDKLTFKMNPTSFLSGQNVSGSNNAHQLVVQTMQRLEQQGIIQFSPAAKQRVKEGHYDIHQMAFNKYLELGNRPKMEVFDLLKTIYGGVCSHIAFILNESYHMYSGTGFIVTNRSLALTVYDKELEIASKKRKYAGQVLPDLPQLRTKMRCEVTVKYSYFSKSKRRMSWWIGKDWDAEAADIIAAGLERFRVDYLLGCPNVFESDYTASWKPKHKNLFKSWQAGSALSKNQRGTLLRFYGFDAELNVTAHRNTLWTLRRTMDGSPPRVSELTGIDHFPGKDLCAPLLPFNSHLCLGADTKTLRDIAERCRTHKA